MRLLAASIIVLTGCSAVVGDVPGDGATEMESAVRASVSVQRTEWVNGSAPGLRTHVAARFLRASGPMDSAERMVDSAHHNPGAALGCQSRGDRLRADLGRNDDAVRGADGTVELIDVGDIMLQAQDRTLALAPRAFPDVGGLVSGVVYTSRDGRSELPDAATYLFDITGAAALDGFSLVAEAPSAPENIHIAGAPLAPLDNADLVLRSGEALDLRWTATADPDDRIYVTVSALRSGADEEDSQAFTCVFEDDGAAEIPARFANFAAGAELDVAIHRRRRAVIVVPGADYDAVVDFDFAVAAQIPVE